VLVPSFLFGTAREVRASIGRALTQIRRGARLDDICESFTKVDLIQHPRSLVWIDAVWVVRPSTAEDYRAVLLTNMLFDPGRIPFERSNVIREQSVEYLSESPWGTVVLNSRQGHYWCHDLPTSPLRPSRHGYLAIVGGTLRHWDAINALGRRYCTGGSNGYSTFAETLPAYGGALARLGVDPRGEGKGWQDIHQLCGDGVLIERLRTDDAFWKEFVRKSQAGAPELVEENLAQITGLCEAGSWDGPQWEFLRNHAGAEAVEQAIAKVEEKRDGSLLMGVLIHALHDMPRATQFFEQHQADQSIHWADERIAEYLKDTDPKRSAAILFESAERQANVGPLVGNFAYRQAIAALAMARDILLNANLRNIWESHLETFRATHRRRPALMRMLEKSLVLEARSGQGRRK